MINKVRKMTYEMPDIRVEEIAAEKGYSNSHHGGGHHGGGHGGHHGDNWEFDSDNFNIDED